MGRLIVEQIISADGYAADADGGIEFFEVSPEAGGGAEHAFELGQAVTHPSGHVSLYYRLT